MRVTIEPALFEDSRRSFDVTRLLCAAVGRPHQLLIGPAGRARPVFERWLTGQGADIQAPLRALLDRSLDPDLTRAPPDVWIRVTETEEERVDVSGRKATATLQRAIKLIESPLHLVLENGVNDAAFLRKAAPPGELRDWLEHALGEKWIDPVNGGGSFLGKTLASYSPWQRLRCWAMCDAETWLPSTFLLTEHDQVRKFRKEADRAPRVPLRVLERRAIENYLPLPALKRWAYDRSGTRQEERRNRTCFVEALVPLDSRRPPHARFPLRHHYHFERGFGAAKEEIPPDYRDFASDPFLAKGLGDPVKRIWASTRRATDGTTGDWLEDGWLAADGQRPEIQRIIASIRSRI